MSQGMTTNTIKQLFAQWEKAQAQADALWGRLLSSRGAVGTESRASTPKRKRTRKASTGNHATATSSTQGYAGTLGENVLEYVRSHGASKPACVGRS